MSLATAAIGLSRLWVVRQNQRAKNVCAAPGCLRDVELVEDDLRRRGVHMGQRHLDLRLPHVHGDRVDPRPLGLGEGPPEAVEALRLPVRRKVQDPTPLQIRDHREIAVPRRTARTEP